MTAARARTPESCEPLVDNPASEGDSAGWVVPRLLTRAQAVRYLGGGDPAKLVDPVRIGRRVLWDRRSLDARLDTISGVGAVQKKRTGGLAQWESENGKA